MFVDRCLSFCAFSLSIHLRWHRAYVELFVTVRKPCIQLQLEVKSSEQLPGQHHRSTQEQVSLK